MENMTKLLLSYSHFVFNSKDVVKGSVFVGLGTGKTNGAIFAEHAVLQGADFLILEQEPNFQIDKSKYIVVNKAIEFITILAKNKFAQLSKAGTKTIAITGSVGKTTTKDLLTFILKKTNNTVFATEKNLNNHIGLPFIILNSPWNVNFLILEMGMSSLGEINHLVNIAPTNVRIITNIYNAHIGNFEDKINGIFKAKTEILNASDEDTIFITHPKLQNLENIKQTFKGQIKLTQNLSNYFIKNNHTFFKAYQKDWELQSPVTKEWLSLFLICLETLKAFDVNTSFELKDFNFTSGRGNTIQIASNSILIDESYNANPESIKNAITKLKLYEGKKCLILGSMKELGDLSRSAHQEIFNIATSLNDVKVFFIGPEFNFDQQNWFSHVDDFISSQIHNLTRYNVVLAKASNSLNFKKIINFFSSKIN